MSAPKYKNLQYWLQWQESLHEKEIDLGLERIRIVYERMQIGWNETKFITVGGTNGKGSTIAFLNEIYKLAGFKVGQFTSPHFLCYNERIQINSQCIDDQSLCDAFAIIDLARGDVSLSYFEFSTLAALIIFSQQDVDVVLMEVGLGGRLDASNLIDMDCSIVTSIGIDHRDWLGDSREAIGFEKAGIFRAGKPAICGDLNIPVTVRQYAETIGAHWFGRDEQFTIEDGQDSWSLNFEQEGQIYSVGALVYPSMLATVQLNNAACAVLVVQLLKEDLFVPHNVLSEAICITSLPGRMQQVIVPESSNFDVFVDVAHNEDAAKSVVTTVQQHYMDRSVYLVLAMLADKEVAATVKVLQQLSPEYYLASPSSSRALAVQDLAKHVQMVGGHVTVAVNTVVDAYQQALQEVRQEPRSSKALVLVLGSFFTVAEVMRLSKRADV